MLALGGRCESGIGLVRRLTGLDAALAEADLVITGEGSFDAQSLRGKVVAGVAAAARAAGRPCVVVAGRVSVGSPEAAAAGVSRRTRWSTTSTGIWGSDGPPGGRVTALAPALPGPGPIEPVHGFSVEPVPSVGDDRAGRGFTAVAARSRGGSGIFPALR